MATLTTQVFKSWPVDYPVPVSAINGSVLTARGLYGTMFYDSAWPGGVGTTRGIVCLQRGSGSTSAPSENTFVSLCLAKGYAVLVWSYPGYWLSPPSFYRYGYGNVNAPMFLGHLIKDAWVTQTMLDWLDENYPNNPIVLAGHSRGGAAQVAWAAGYTCRPLQSRVRGVLAMGATMAGLGDLSWNDMMRNLNTFSNMINLLQKRVILAYGDLDDFAPPDYVRRLQVAIDTTKDVYVVSPGELPHVWYDTNPGAAYAADWVQQLMTQGFVYDRFGLPATRGPVVPTGPAEPGALMIAGICTSVLTGAVGHFATLPSSPPSAMQPGFLVGAPPGANLVGLYTTTGGVGTLYLSGAPAVTYIAGKTLKIDGVTYPITWVTVNAGETRGTFDFVFTSGQTYRVEFS
jgi:pimeloyl-ACP methyl ester carboxylesterase